MAVALASSALFAVLATSGWARPAAGQPDEQPAVKAPAPAPAPAQTQAASPPGRPAGGEGGGGFNPGGGGGSGYNPGNPGQSGSRPSHGSGSSGGANPGHGSGPHPGQGGGYNPGNGDHNPGHNPGHNASGVWNGHAGEGWNPGNYYRPAVIQGWVRLGSAEAGKGADKDIIHAYGSYRYSVIKLCVRRADVRFHEARVIFAKEGQQDLRLNRKVSGGSCTPNLNLRGGRRTDIRYVYLYFRQADDILNWRTAEVDLYAR
ncbi:MAG: hypothetical protein ACOYLV_03070 [Rubrivivax sp.]